MPSYKKTAYYLIAAVFLLSLDRALKTLVYLNQELELDIIGGYFKLSFALNPYIAFSLPLGGPVLIAVIAAIMLFVLLGAARLQASGHYHAAGLFFLIFAGAASNLFDRFKYGAVVDYFDLKFFTVFNLADLMIVTAALALFFVVIPARQ